MVTRVRKQENTEQQKMQQYNGITEGVIWQQILLFFFPILFGTFFQQLYNTADAMIVGKFVGKEALSAVGGTTGTLINLLVGFFVGLSSGAAVVVSQYYGARHENNVRTAVHTAFCLAIGGGVALMIIGELFAPWAIRMMGAPEEIIDYAVTYLRIYFIGVIPNLVYNMGASILRAVGDSKRPLYFLIASCLTNIGLDLLFVVVLGLEVMGVAIATILSQFLSAILVMITLIRSKESYRFELKALRCDRKFLRRIIRIGLPTGLQSTMYAISNVLIQSSINSFGTNTIAAWTAYGKIDGLFWMTLDAMGISITTFAGQNFGAGKIDRLKRSTYVGIVMSSIATVTLCALMLIFGADLCRLFTNDEAVLAENVNIIRFLAPLWLTYVLAGVFPSVLRGIGDTLVPMLIIAFGTCLLRIVWIFTAGVVYPGFYTIIASYPITWSVTSIMFIIYYYRFSMMRKISKSGKAGVGTF